MSSCKHKKNELYFYNNIFFNRAKIYNNQEKNINISNQLNEVIYFADNLINVLSNTVICNTVKQFLLSTLVVSLSNW